MTDYQGLFNCLRPEPVDMGGAFSPETGVIEECDFCINRATRSVTYRENGRQRHVYTCDECHAIETINREIINIEKL